MLKKSSQPSSHPVINRKGKLQSQESAVLYCDILGPSSQKVGLLKCARQWQIQDFLTGSPIPEVGGVNLLFRKSIAANYIKVKKIGSRGSPAWRFPWIRQCKKYATVIYYWVNVL